MPVATTSAVPLPGAAGGKRKRSTSPSMPGAAPEAASAQTGAALAAALRTSSPDSLRLALAALRRSTSIATHDEAPAPTDARVRLAQEFVDAGGLGGALAHDAGWGAVAGGAASSPGLFDAWTLAEQQALPALLPLPLFVLAHLLALLSAHQPTHALGDRVIEPLLPPVAGAAPAAAPRFWARLQAYLGSAESKKGKAPQGTAGKDSGSEMLTLATVRLLLEMSSFAGGKYARRIFEGVGWSMKTLPRLLNMRRRAPSAKAKAAGRAAAPVTLTRPDVRTLWLLFLLSFLHGSSSLKQSLLGLGRDFLPAAMKGLSRDPPQVVLHVLQSLHEGLLSENARSPRARVVGFFNEWTCKEIVALYERNTERVGIVGSADEPLSVADVAHHFLLALCSHRGRGICFADRGWYGRADAADDADDGEGGQHPGEPQTARGPRIHNKILLGILRSLSPTRSLAQGELALQILLASPELVGPFLDSPSGSISAASLEPRAASSAWLCTAAFLGRALSLPLPDFRRVDGESTGATAWLAEPPPLDSVLAALLPCPLSRGLLQRGITHADRLTRHAALALLSRVLDRLSRFRAVCLTAAEQIGEGAEIQDFDDDASAEPTFGLDGHGHWTRRWKEVEREVRRRLPDLSALVGGLQSLGSQSQTEASEDGPAQDRGASPSELLLTEAHLRAVWLYQTVLPGSFLTDASRLDVGRLLVNDFMAPASEAVGSGPDKAAGMRNLCQLHALRIVALTTGTSGAGEGGFDLFARASSSASSRSYFCLLLTVRLSTGLELVREACDSIFAAALGKSALFEHDPDEWQAWLHALPLEDVRPSGESLSEEQAGVLVFLDECVQRCLKTHYRYLEASRRLRAEHAKAPSGLPTSNAGSDDTDLAASPLLSTVAEQLSIRLRKGLLDVQTASASTRGYAERTALLAFVNRLMLGLVGAGRPVSPLLALATELREAAADDAAACPPVVFLANLTVSRLEAIGHGPRDHTTPSTTAENVFAGATTTAELRTILRQAERPLAATARSALEAAVRRLFSNGCTAALQLMRELDPRREHGALDDEIRLHLPSEASLYGLEPASSDDSSAASEAHICAAIAVSRLQTWPEEWVLAQLAAALGPAPSAQLIRGIFGNGALLHHLSTAGAAFVAALADLLSASDATDPAQRSLALPVAERALDLLADESALEAVLPAFQALVPLLDNDTRRRVTAAMVEVLRRRDVPTKATVVQSAVRNLLAVLESDSSLALALDGAIEALLGLIEAAPAATPDDALLHIFAVLYRALASSTVPGLDGARRRSGQLASEAAVDSSAFHVPVRAILERHTPVADATLALLLYRCPAAVAQFLEELSGETRPAPALAALARAFPRSTLAALDLCEPVTVAAPLVEALTTTLATLAFDLDSSIAVPSCTSLALLRRQSSSSPDALTLPQALSAAMPEKASVAFQPAVFQLVISLLGDDASATRSLAQQLVDQGLLWLVRRFAEDAEDSVALVSAIGTFSELVTSAGQSGVLPKPHLAEHVVEAAIKNRLAGAPQMRLVATLCRFTPFKTAVRSAQTSSVLAHPLFRTAAQPGELEADAPREAIIGVLYHSIASDAAALSRPATIAALLRIYSATLSTADRRLLEVFGWFERQERASLLSLATQWSPPAAASGAGSTSNSPFDAVLALEPARAFATCAAYPRARCLHHKSAGMAKQSSTAASAVYDPIWVMALVAAMLLQKQPLTGLQWLAVLRTNALGVVVCALSSRSRDVRAEARAILARAHIGVSRTHFQEREHLLLALDALRDAMPVQDTTPLPLTTTLFVAHVLRSLSAPSSFTYPIFSRFLLQRAELDLGDVPLLYNMLLSSSDEEHRQERVWMLRFLRDCLRAGGRAEWRVFKRRHVWELLASLYTATAPGSGAPTDRAVRSVIEEIFLAGASLPTVAFELLQRRALISWVAQQVSIERAPSGARRFWVTLLDTATSAVDLERLDRGTSGAWASALLDALAGCIRPPGPDAATTTPDDARTLRAMANALRNLLCQQRRSARTLAQAGLRLPLVVELLSTVLARLRAATAAASPHAEQLADEAQSSTKQDDADAGVHAVYEAVLALYELAPARARYERTQLRALFSAAARAEIAHGGEEARHLWLEASRGGATARS